MRHEHSLVPLIRSLRLDKPLESTNHAARCLDSFIGTHGHFNGTNVTRYLRDYESKMKVNLVDTDIALVN